MSESGKAIKVEVTILDDQYYIKGTYPPEYIEMLAYELDRRLRRAKDTNPRLSNYQTAVLTALNILEEYTRLQQEQRRMEELLDESGEPVKK